MRSAEPSLIVPQVHDRRTAAHVYMFVSCELFPYLLERKALAKGRPGRK